jgi:hypothetical protein
MLTTVLCAVALSPQGPKATPTFCADVAPIVFSRCAQCHRPGEVAPFSLLSYAEVKKRRRGTQTKAGASSKTAFGYPTRR